MSLIILILTMHLCIILPYIKCMECAIGVSHDLEVLVGGICSYMGPVLQPPESITGSPYIIESYCTLLQLVYFSELLSIEPEREVMMQKYMQVQKQGSKITSVKREGTL